MDELVYYVDYQGTRIVVLDSNEHHAEQAIWLETVLKDNPSRWTIVSMHHPVYSVVSAYSDSHFDRRQSLLRGAGRGI